MQITQRDRVVAALTIMGEALPNHDQDRLAIACVILNRAFNPRWWGKGVAGVCLAPWQFSCWNTGYSHHVLWHHKTHPDKVEYVLSLAEVQPFLDVFDRAVAGERPSPDFAATHYARTDWIETGKVSWAKSRDASKGRAIGEHTFFRPQDLDRPEKPIVPYEPAITPPPARDSMAQSKTVGGAVLAGGSALGLGGLVVEAFKTLGALDWRVGLAAVLVVGALAGAALVIQQRHRKWLGGDR